MGLDENPVMNIYVGDDKQIHFVDKAGADSVLPFSSVGVGSWEADLTITFRLTRSFGPSLNYTGKGVYHITCTNGSISSTLKSGTNNMLTDADNGAVVKVAIESMAWSNYKTL